MRKSALLVSGLLLSVGATRAQQAGLWFVPVTPCRVADTRSATGPFGGPAMGADSTRSFAIPQSACGIPASAQAYSLNVTVVPGGPLSYLTLWPTGQPQPFVSTLNSYDGSVVANAAIVPAGSNGAVSVYVTDPTHVILDINGYFDTSTGPTSYAFYPATPCRVADTRGAASQFGGPEMQANQTRDFPIPLSSCEIPGTARAYSLNVTVVPSGFLGYLATWPTGQAQPNVSTLNSYNGTVLANAALVPAGTNESISVFVTNPTNVILDIDGYFGQPGSPNALAFYPVTPCRVADTRNPTGPFGGPLMGASATRSFTIPASACNIPSTAEAYSLNVTVVPDGPLDYLSVWPAGAAQPQVSTLNSYDGSVLANAAIVPAGTNGAIDVFVTNPTHVILDINGYFAPIGNQPPQSTYDLNLFTSGTGQGTIYIQNLSGGNNLGTGGCGLGCYVYPAGTALLLTETASAGSTFAGWSGACFGTGSCNVTMNQDQTVTADFEVGGGTGTQLSGPVSGTGSNGTNCPTSFNGTITIQIYSPGGTTGGWSMNGTLVACNGSQPVQDGGDAQLTLNPNGTVSVDLYGQDYCVLQGSGTLTSLSGSGNCPTPLGGTVSFSASAGNNGANQTWLLDFGPDPVVGGREEIAKVIVSFPNGASSGTFSETSDSPGVYVYSPDGTCSYKLAIGGSVSHGGTYDNWLFVGVSGAGCGMSSVGSGTGTANGLFPNATSVTGNLTLTTQSPLGTNSVSGSWTGTRQ